MRAPAQARACRPRPSSLPDVEPGEEVLTAGGLIGTVRALDGDIVQLELADGVVVRVDLRAVAGRVSCRRDDPPEPTRPSEPS